ncbi:MAG: hypothetical protein F4145_10210 [Boseongicola sp. SB0675_bin_26]|nr:hypothetical protein [Boseongicola sp. SB0675_bin_26]
MKIATEEFRINSPTRSSIRMAEAGSSPERGPSVGKEGPCKDRGAGRPHLRTRDLSLVAGIGGEP